MPSAFEKHNLAILVHYVRDTVLPMLKDDGVWMAPDPAPLNGEDVERAFAAICQSPNYSRQHLSTRTQDGFLVTAYNGVITKEQL